MTMLVIRWEREGGEGRVGGESGGRGGGRGPLLPGY